MKSIRYIIVASLALTLFAGCSKNYLPVSDHPFDISTPVLESSRVRVDIIPDNNDFYYMFGVWDAAAIDILGDKEFVALADETLKDLYKILYETESLDKYLNWMYRGAYDEVTHGLTPDTRYYAYAFPYNDTVPMAEKLTKIEFRTPKAKVSDITFDLSVLGTKITAKPSNNDKYFCDYCTQEELDKDYYSSPAFFYESIINTYWEYGFFPDCLNSGENTGDVADWYDVKDGDVFYLVISGYDEGTTGTIFYYKVTVSTDPQTQGTVEQISGGPININFTSTKKSDLPKKAALNMMNKSDYSASKISLKRSKR